MQNNEHVCNHHISSLCPQDELQATNSIRGFHISLFSYNESSRQELFISNIDLILSSSPAY